MDIRPSKNEPVSKTPHKNNNVKPPKLNLSKEVIMEYKHEDSPN